MPAERRPAARAPWRLRSAQLGALVLWLGAWELFVRQGGVNPLYLPAPSAIAQALQALFAGGELLHHTAITLGEFGVGYGAAVLAGIAGGLLLALSPRLERFANPFIAAVMSVPKVAIVPLLALWLGIGFGHKVVIVFLFCVFQIHYSTVAGVKQTRREHLRVARALGASTLQTVWKVLLPSALPAVFAALRVSAAVGLVGALFGEMLSSKAGLGNLITRAGAALDTPATFALIGVVTILSVAMVGALDWIERLVFLRWRET